MTKVNPFQKASRGAQHARMLLTGGSGSGKTLTALQLACHMAAALGRPGSVAVIDSEDGTAKLYSYDDVTKEPYLCACEQCMKATSRLPLEFDHVDMRDHSPSTYRGNMRAAFENGYAVLVIDSASHEWCGVNGCLEQVDALAGDRTGRQVDNAWKVVTDKHNAFLADIRSIPINLVATARVKPGRGDNKADEIIIQRDKDGPFEFEFQMWGRTSRSQPGTVHIKKSRSGHFSGTVWKKAGKFAAEQILLWAGQIRQDAPRPSSNPPGGGGRAVEQEERPAPARPPAKGPTGPRSPEEKARNDAGERTRHRHPDNCTHPSWSPGQATDGNGLVHVGTSCDGCGLFREDEAPPADPTPTGPASPADAAADDRGHMQSGSPVNSPAAQSAPQGTSAASPSLTTAPGSAPTEQPATGTSSQAATPGRQPAAAAPSAPGADNAASSADRSLVVLVESITADINQLEAQDQVTCWEFLDKASGDRDKLTKLAAWVKRKLPAAANR